MIDTHCHISLSDYDNIDELILKIKSSGVNKIIVNGCDLASNIEVLSLIKKYDIVYGALGLHPTELSSDNDMCIDFISSHCNDDKIVAIGEIGLDYHYDDYDKNMQIKYFRKQLEIANKFNLPVIVHTRDSIQDSYDILSEYNLSGSIHCFGGSLEMAREFIKLGYFLGVGGVVTYKNAKNIINVLDNISLDSILLETDAPYLSPEPYRGQKNDSSNILVIANKIAEIKGVNIEEVVKITSRNAASLFDF